MKLNTQTVLSMAKRKGLTLVAGIAIGAVLCVIDKDVYDLVSKAVVVVGGAGGGGVVLSIILSLLNESKQADIAEQNLYKTPEGLKMVPADATVIETVKGT